MPYRAVAPLASVAVVGLAAVVESLTPPTSVWPVNVAGWVALAASLAAVGGVLRMVHRAGIDRAVKDKADDARMTAIDERLNAFHQSVDTQLNGFGRRVEKLEESGESDRNVVNGVLQSLVEARVHREHVGESLKRIETSLEAVTRALMQREPHA